MTDHLDGQVVLTAATTPKLQHSNTSPANRETAATIARLLLHYPIGGMSDAARAAMAEDWLEDLREFGPEVVREACATWRQQPGGRRPTPGDIRVLCIAEQRRQNERTELKALPSPNRVAMAAEANRQKRELEMEGRLLANEWARSQGYVDMDEALAAGRKYSEVIASFTPIAGAPGFKTPGAFLGSQPIREEV